MKSLLKELDVEGISIRNYNKRRPDLREKNTDIVYLLINAHILEHFVSQIKDVLYDY